MANQNPLATNLTLEQQKNLFGNAYLNMLWHCPTDLRFHYWVHLPDYYYDEEEHEYSLLVIIHGTGCAIEEYIKQAKELADKYHMAVLAPMFPGGLIQRDDFNSYKLLSCDGIRYDLILLDMIEDMAKRYPGVHTDQFFMFGHSGGGQFVNRFLLAHPDRLKACSIGAPGRPTFLNPDEDYFWGIRDFKDYFGYDVDLEAVKKVPVLISVGELDNKFIGDSPYGDNRVARMKSLQKNFQEHGVLFAPAKASNAGGVATSGLEMSQNSERLSWTFEEVDAKLKGIMEGIFHASYDASVAAGSEGNLMVGANCAGFLKVATAMMAQGITY